MATITGRFVDEATGKPLSDVEIDVFVGSDTSGTPVASFQSNEDGTFSFTSPYFDSNANSISVEYPGYYQLLGNVEFFYGDITLTPTQVTKAISAIPGWAWALVVAVAGFLIFKYGKKLL